MEYLDFWVTQDGVKPFDIKKINKEYEITNFMEGSS